MHQWVGAIYGVYGRRFDSGRASRQCRHQNMRGIRISGVRRVAGRNVDVRRRRNTSDGVGLLMEPSCLQDSAAELQISLCRLVRCREF